MQNACSFRHPSIHPAIPHARKTVLVTSLNDPCVKIGVLSWRNLSLLQHPETTITALKKTHTDPHHCGGWINTKMTLWCIFYSSPSLTLTPPHLPMSIQRICLFSSFDCVIYQTRSFHLPHVLFSFPVILGCKNTAARSWWETKGSCFSCGWFGSGSGPVWSFLHS